jgi:hypothetical protein
MRCAALAISTSRTSSRGRKAAIAAGCMVGLSFMLCTAASMRPASSACSISLDEQALAARFSQRPAWIVSPVVRMVAISIAPVWVRASLLPRVPRQRRGAAMTALYRSAASEARTACM